MSGICGIFNYASDIPVDRADLDKMLDAVDYPGAISRDIMISSDGRTVFGCITPESAKKYSVTAQQKGKAMIVLSGPAFCKGQRIDAADVLKQYLDNHENSLTSIHGPYSCAIYDTEKKRICLVRDRIGATSLYFTKTGRNAVFSSDLKAIPAHHSVKTEIDDEGLFHHLTFGAVPPPHTMFKGIRKIAPSEIVTVNREGEEEFRKYWNMLASAGQCGGSIDNICERISGLIDDAVRLNKPVGEAADIFISGGVDSAAMLACLRKNHSGKIRSYTAGFTFNGKPVPGELDEARVAADHFSTVHSEIIIELNDIGRLMWDVACEMDDPYSASESPLMSALSRKASETGADAVFYGEGADGAFPGDSLLGMARLYGGKAAMLRKIPRFITRTARLIFDYSGFGHGGRGEFFSELLWRVGHNQKPFWGTATVMNDRKKTNLLPRRLNGMWRSHRSDEFVDRMFDELEAILPDADWAQKIRYVNYHMWTSEYWAKSSFRLYGLRAAMPFLYEPLIEYAMSIPIAIIRREGSAKSILRKAVAPALTGEMTRRKKTGFSEPLENWFDENLVGILEPLMEECPDADDIYINFQGVRNIIAEHRSGKANHKWMLFYIITLLMWYRRWLMGIVERPHFLDKPVFRKT